MSEAQIAYLAGFLTGRGAFGLQDGRHWLFIRTLDRDIAEAAMQEWGGHLSLQGAEDGRAPLYKWQVSYEEARKALEAVSPYLMGIKRQRAACLLNDYERVA